jgi:hypothetical protein
MSGGKNLISEAIFEGIVEAEDRAFLAPGRQ